MKARLALLLAGLLLLAGCAATTPPPPGERIVRNVPYKYVNGQYLSLDIYKAKGADPHPLVIWIHGGGWKYGDKAWMLFLRHITQYGFDIASLEYRLSGRAKYPAQYEDCRDAFNFLEANAGKYAFQRNNFFLGGASAGGHLVALLGLREGRDRVNAVFAQYPPTDLLGFKNQDRTRGYLPELLGGSVNTHRALARDGSPVDYVTRRAPPFLFIHGEKDQLVPIDQSRKLDAELRAAGVESRLVVIPGAGHGFALTDAQVQDVARFFQRHLRPAR
jgi:acetyl esterase/lipase